MKPQCHSIREALADDGPRALQQDTAAQEHVAGCDDCFAFLQALTQIDEGLENLKSHDVADDVVATLLARPELTQPSRPASLPSRARQLAATLGDRLRPRPLVWSSVAAGFMIVAVALVLQSEGMLRESPAPAAPPISLQDAMKQAITEERLRSLGYLGDAEPEVGEKKRKALPFEPMPVPESPDPSTKRTDNPLSQVLATRAIDDLKRQESSEGIGDDFMADLPIAGRFYQNVLTLAPGVSDGDERAATGKTEADKSDADSRINTDSIEEMELITRGAGVEFGRLEEQTIAPTHRVAPIYPEAAKAAGIEATVTLQIALTPTGSVSAVERVVRCDRPGIGFEQAAIDAVLQWRYEAQPADGQAIERRIRIDVHFTLERDEVETPDDDRHSSRRADPAARAAQAFLAERERIDGLVYRPGTGYWANSYLPGDPAMRMLASRLRNTANADALAAVDGSRLHESAQRVGQPFDSPDGSALALYLQADRRGLSEPGRMLLQVGIQGTPRHGGRRPAMNVAVVLDLRDALSQHSTRSLRALLEALNRAQEPGDRFQLLAAGRDETALVEADDFRHGVLKVTLNRWIATPPRPASSLAETLSAAIERVTVADDDDAPLGSSAVLLVTPRALGSELDELLSLAHRGAVAGVQLSSIALGDGIRPDEMERLALAGQGSRRMLDDPSAAADIVDRELASASRAIARAVRLRIRLAPGVQLVDVIGSEPLDAKRTQRVRDAERSIDQRLARRLGIEADRGEDEEGIQIVIPSFYAGDEHVVLLDVVAPGAGAIADVTMRYKDLIQLKNSVARAGLAVGRDAAPAGPLQRNVTKNLLSQRLADCLAEAAELVRGGDSAQAAGRIESFSKLLEGLRRELPSLAGDTELGNDIAMLAAYRTALSNEMASNARLWLADSMTLAAKFKLLPRPSEVTS